MVVASGRDARDLRPRRGRRAMGDEDPGVSLRSTPGYRLASLRLATRRFGQEVSADTRCTAIKRAAKWQTGLCRDAIMRVH